MRKLNALVMLCLLVVTLVGCGGSNEPDISIDQIKEDLLENGVWIASWTRRPSSLYSISEIELLKSQTAEKQAAYWVLISYEWGDRSGSGSAEEVKIDYEKFDQGWQFVKAQFVN